MLRRQINCLVVKKVGVGAALGGAGASGTAGKLQNDEKFSLAALEYVYEANLANDGVSKRAPDVAKERRVSEAYDRYASILDVEFDRRVDRLTQRMNEALDALPAEYLEEATLLNSEAPPLAFRLPKLSPPVPGFEPAFGFDVPQLRVAQQDDRPVRRMTEKLQLQATLEATEELERRVATARPGGGADESAASSAADGGSGAAEGGSGGEEQTEMTAVTFPFVDGSDVRAILRTAQDKMDELHGAMRSAVPLTGTSGEEWEAHCALQHRAFARQQLILDLADSPDLQAKFAEDKHFAAAERARRGLLPLEEESAPAEFDLSGNIVHHQQDGEAEGKSLKRVLPVQLPEMHYAQTAKYHAFRQE